MPKKLVIISVFLVLVVGAAAFAATRGEKPTQTSVTSSQKSNQAQPETPQAQPQPAAQAEAGKYLDYTDEQFTAIAGKKVLFFHAPWCGQCRSIEAGITEGSVPSGVSIFKVDYDSRQDIRQKYGVTMRTSFVVLDEQGSVTKKYIAYDDPYFESVKKQIF